MTRRAFVVDLNRCTGCHACEMACQITNGVPGDRRWRRVRTFNEMHVHGVENLHLSLACNHCAAAPCLEQCPARAYRRDEPTGAVLIDQDKCLGCRYCAWVCPYGAPRFDEERGVMSKCTFCADLQGEGRAPACVTACPTGALDWGELEPDELTCDVPGVADVGAAPSLRVVPLRPGRLAPRQTETPALPPWRALWRRVTPQVSFAHEWTLAVFTLVLAALAGAFVGGQAGGPRPHGLVFLAFGCGALALGAWHLGRRERAWRAGLHADRSWLSREILLSGAFLGLGGAVLLADGAPAIFGWTAAALGLAALFAVDRVYRAARIRGAVAVHSAQVLGTGLLLAALWAGAWWSALSLAGLKVLLYAARKGARARLGLAQPALPVVLRIGQLASGLAAVRQGYWAAGLVLVVLAEFIDRAEYYDELEIIGPETLLLDELAARPAAHGAEPRTMAAAE